MAVPPLWKVRRELRRAYARAQVAFRLRLLNRKSVSYHGFSVPVKRSGMSLGVLVQIDRDDYEVPEILGLKAALMPGDRVLELGSGLGIITALIARKVGSTGKVLSFEANPALIEDTKKFLADHGVSNVELRHSVLIPDLSPDKMRRFHVDGSFPSSSLLELGRHEVNEIIEVPAQGVGAVMKEFGPTVLICDIEGGEVELIPAIDASNLRAVVIEHHPGRVSQQQIDAIERSLASHGLLPSKEQLGGTVTLYVRTT